MAVWSAAVIADLSRLWREGRTAEEIGRRLGLTKSAVLGKVHRLELAPRRIRKPKVANSPNSSKGRRANETAHPWAPPQPLRDVPAEQPSRPAEGEADPWTERRLARPATKEEYAARGLARRPCQWPSGDPREADFHVCGERAVIGRPYCADHCAAAYLIPRSAPVRAPEEADASSDNTSPARLRRREPADRVSRDANASVASGADAPRPQGLEHGG